eukprot:g24346.t1
MSVKAGVAEVAQFPFAVGIVQLRKSEKSAIPGVPVERGTDVFHKQVWPGLTVACLDQTCLCPEACQSPFSVSNGNQQAPISMLAEGLAENRKKMSVQSFKYHGLLCSEKRPKLPDLFLAKKTSAWKACRRSPRDSMQFGHGEGLTGSQALLKAMLFAFGQAKMISIMKSLIEQLRKKLSGFVCYNESKHKWVKSDRLIITPNSLIKTKYNRMPIPPVLIFDEVESAIATVFGKTMAKDRVASVDYLKELLTKVSVVIASDASAGSLTLETLRAFRPVKFHYILSTYQKPLNERYKVCVSYDENAWRQGIIDRHRRGLVQFTHANSLEYAEKLAEELDDKDRVRVITSNTPGQEVRKLIENIDKLVDSGRVTHIVYSPKIEAGVSWNTKKCYCINAWASDKITSPPALMQSIVRVREPITGIINLCLKEVAPTDRIMLRPVLYQEVKQALEDGDCSLDEFCLKQELKHFPCMQHALVLHTMNKNEYYNDYEQTLFRLMHENQMTVLVDIGDRRTKAPATEASSRYESRRADDIFNAKQISDDQVFKTLEAAVQASQDEVGYQDSIKRHFLQLLLQHNESLLTAENIREFGLYRQETLDKLKRYKLMSRGGAAGDDAYGAISYLEKKLGFDPVTGRYDVAAFYASFGEADRKWYAKHQNAIRAGLRDTLKNKCLKLDESQVSPGKLIDLYMLLHKEVTGLLVARQPEKRIRVRCGGQPWSETSEIEMNMRQFRFYNAVCAEVAAPSQECLTMKLLLSTCIEIVKLAQLNMPVHPS